MTTSIVCTMHTHTHTHAKLVCNLQFTSRAPPSKDFPLPTQIHPDNMAHKDPLIAEPGKLGAGTLKERAEAIQRKMVCPCLCLSVRKKAQKKIVRADLCKDPRLKAEKGRCKYTESEGTSSANHACFLYECEQETFTRTITCAHVCMCTHGQPFFSVQDARHVGDVCSY
jgi:hypothetical protein